MQEDNVQVAVRVRPLLPKEQLASEQMCVRIIPTTKQIVMGKDRAFTYDHVLSSKSTQTEVYETCVEPLVNSLFEGYNSTVFAYGQTGSGKTFTIGGGNITSLTEEEYGILPRALKEMFYIMQENSKVEYSVRVSYIEIYKEELKDLLDADSSNKDLHVREDENGNTVITGTREVACESLDEVMDLLECGSAARQTGSTQMNEHSSRSHSIFTIVISQSWNEDDFDLSRNSSASKSRKVSVSDSSESLPEISHFMSGKFHFVDLAGSERAHRTGNVGDRFKESIHINTGLLSLGNVISALGDPKKKSTHIPYRDSKITRLLKDSLGGNAKTLMICCISPAASNFDESLNALKYANRARNIKNKPIINRDIQSIRFEEMQSEIKALREELSRQRTSVFSAAGGDCNMERAMQDANHIKDLEDSVIRLQTECAHYRMIAEEAYKQLMEIQDRDILTKSQDFRLKDWLELMEEIKNKVPSTLTPGEMENKTIIELEHQLKKCRADLVSDEEIFSEKAKEMNSLSNRIVQLEDAAEDTANALLLSEEVVQKQEQQLLQQQIKIEELQKALKSALVRQSSIIDSDCTITDRQPTSSRRPKSVPVHLHRQPSNNGNRPLSRNIKTSPALFSLERVMQSFRARSQLLVSRLEDHDDVLHQTFSDDSSYSDSEGDVEGQFVRKGTFRVKKGGCRNDTVDGNNPSDVRSSTRILDHSMDMQDGRQQESRLTYTNIETRTSAEIQKKKIKQAQLKVLESNQKMRDLSINIRMKEQLICELVKTGKDAELMNKQYEEKIKSLEKMKQIVEKELQGTQRALQDLEHKEHQETAEKQKLQTEYKKKIDAAKSKMTALQQKQRDTKKVVDFAEQNEKKIQDLQLAVDRMKQQQDHLHKKLKDETEQKSRIERDMQKELQKVKELEIKNEQQQKILKRKNEEIAAAQRRLRSGSLPPIQMEQLEKLEEQKRWLDGEMEKIIQQRQQMEGLQEELRKREDIIVKKEAILSEKSELEIKKLRSSQMLSKDLVTMSSKLDSIEKRIDEKKKEYSEVPEDRRSVVKEEMQKLKHSRDKLQKRRLVIDEKLGCGEVLSHEEERRLIELDEAIEALDAAIEFKNETITSRQTEIRQSQIITQQSDESVMNRINLLKTSEIKSLLARYFDKVITLREEERRITLTCSEYEVKVDEQERLIRELESALQRTKLDIDRRLTKQQREYEQKIQLLMNQLTDGGMSSGDAAVDVRMQQLEKELYYYKKTSRDLKKKIRDLISSGVLTSQAFEDISVINSLAETPRSVTNKEIPRSRPSTSRDRDPGDYRNSARSVRNSTTDLPQITTPVKISRKDLRPMTDEEVQIRKSNISKSINGSHLHDSLESQNNPWS
ncbi:hypothetical protein SNE40_003312 [Patella caerulea]|uniref:Kinesin motor domain-containing protein n=1 Tax=Patella caerulea TaxID=87958 RepID=A0AAN8K2R6_PATCE